MPPFDVTQIDLSLHAEFQEPAFDLFRDSWGFHRHLFSKMAQHGVRLTDLRTERGSGSVGDFHFLCYLFNFAVAVRIKLERVEIQGFNIGRIESQRLNQATVELLELVRSHVSGGRFKSFTLSSEFHGNLAGSSVRDFINGFIARGPEALGPSIGNGAVFYYGAEGERAMAAVTIDMSAVISGGLFVRAQAIWDGSRVDARAVPDIATRYVAHVMDQLGLTINGGVGRAG